MKTTANNIIYLAVAQFIVMNIAYDLFKIDNIWFLSNAITVFLLSIAFHLINKGLASNVLMFFAFNMLWEEIYGNPLMTSIYEYLAALIFIVIISIQHFLKVYERINNGISD